MSSISPPLGRSSTLYASTAVAAEASLLEGDHDRPPLCELALDRVDQMTQAEDFVGGDLPDVVREELDGRLLEVGLMNEVAQFGRRAGRAGQVPHRATVGPWLYREIVRNEVRQAQPGRGKG